MRFFIYDLDMKESQKQANFKRLAEARTEKILDQLDLIGNLSNTSFYSYSKKDIDAIFNAIEESVKENKKKFTKKNSKRRFTL